MRIYSTLKEAFSETEREVYEMGIRTHSETMQNKYVADDKGYETLELTAYSYAIRGPKSYLDVRDEMSLLRPELMNYISEEYIDRILEIGVNPGNSWEFRKEVWEQFRNPEDGRFDYTYSERMSGQITQAINQLKHARDSRQVVITIYDRWIDHKRWGKRRIPCSIHYQFLMRNGALNLVYVMRSCDLYTHFPVDVALALMLQAHVAEKTDSTPGNFYHQIGSLHLYAKDARPGVF